MKYPIYIASLVLISAGVSLAGPPSKIHQPNYKNLRAQQQERMDDQQQRVQRQNQNRPTTIALNIGEAKDHGRKLNRNQFHSYRHKAR